jgi:putative nucleotidyltransferase with HDIG domain
MIESFKRLRLHQKGLSCGKKRREREMGQCREFLCTSPVVMGLLLGLAGLFFGWLVLWRPAFGVPHVDEPIRAVMVMGLLFFGAILQFSLSQPTSFHQNSRLLLVFSLLGLHLGLMKVLLLVVDDYFLAGHYRLLLMPHALAPLALTILLGRGHGIFATIFIALWGCLMLPEKAMLSWLVSSLSTGLVAVAAGRQARRRQHVLRAGLLVGLTAFALATLFGHFASLTDFHWRSRDSWQGLLGEAAFQVGLSLATAMVVSSLLPLLESTFRVTTAGSWLEMGDLNHPLLRRMTIEAPGTYHHSLMVANLAEAAADVIGADGLRTRVCAYFHDIGKLKNPEYFIENQSHDENPHDAMTPSMSALVVISHVKDGVDLALRHKLNREIVDVIEQHHGTSLARFFYQRAMAKRDHWRALADEDKAHETDVPEVEESTFRYPGPLPQTREAGLISLADAIESASRSLEKPTPARVEQLVSEIVESRVLDGQLDECPLTLGELGLVKESFTNTLRSMLHKRVSYARAEGPPGGATEEKVGAKTPATPRTAGGRTTRFEVIRGGGGGRAA